MPLKKKLPVINEEILKAVAGPSEKMKSEKLDLFKRMNNQGRAIASKRK